MWPPPPGNKRSWLLADLSSTVYPRLNKLNEPIDCAIVALAVVPSLERTRTTVDRRPQTLPVPRPMVPTNHDSGDSGDSGVRRAHSSS